MIIRFSRVLILGLLLSFASSVLAQSNKYQQLQPQVVEDRLRQYSGTDPVREATLKKLFQQVGCSEESLKEQPVRNSNAPNVSCTLPGTGEEIIIVGAHFDHIDAGSGVVDNWSGASFCPASMKVFAQCRGATLLFSSVSRARKKGLSAPGYVAGLSKEEIARIRAMIDIDTLGLGPTEIWVSNSDPELVQDLFALASTMKLPLREMNVDGLGDSDGHSFKSRHIPIITIHSVTRETLKILHTSRDNYSAIKLDDYYNSYKLIAAYLATLDSKLTRISRNPTRVGMRQPELKRDQGHPVGPYESR